VPLNVGVIIKLEPDFSEGNVSYNPDGTLNRAETKNTLGPHSAVAAQAAFFAKVMYDAKISIGTMGPPIADLALKQAQEMQARMAKIQEELAGKTVGGSSGGGMVQVTVNGQFNLTAVKIEAAAINADEKDMLEDLILAAVNDGMRKARELASAEMAKLTGGLKIPGLMP